MARIQLIGGSGSGKTTLGLALAARLGAPFVDLDDLYWEPGWREVGHAELQRRVTPIAARDDWVIADNYGATAEVLVWPRLTQLVVLDLPYPAMVRRILRRSLWRILHRESCCNGNRESVSRLFHRNAPMRYFTRTWRRRHERYAALANEPAVQHAQVVHLTSQRAIDAWLAQESA